MATLVFNGERIEVRVGETILAAARRSSQGTREIASSCPGTGLCKECIVQIKGGSDALTPPSEHEAFLQRQSDDEQRTFRLACQAAVARSDAVIEVETFKRRLEIAVTGRPALEPFEPWIQRKAGSVHFDGQKLLRHEGPIYGLAIDIGTTTVVMHIVDLETNETLGIRAFENPQTYGGSDVMHRISYDKAHPGQLHQTIIAHVNNLISGLPIDPAAVLAVTVAGNPTMRDLLFGLDVQPIGQSPFMSQTQAEALAGRRASTAIWTEAEQLELHVHPRAQVYGLPLISHHVGADTAAVLATIPVDQHADPFMVIDIGTNTEVVVGNRDRLIAASCAAGPAFEGGRVTCGMAACEGAITGLHRHGGRWEVSSIGTAPIRGICGSGLVDVLAGLRASDEMDEMGRFRDGRSQIAVADDPPLFFTRSDASELALTKAAIGLGQAVLLRRFGIDPSQLGAYYFAGAFANNMNLTSARRIGLILPVPEERVVRIGNASIEGAKASLVSRSCRDRIEALVHRIEHVQLEKEPDFFNLYTTMTRLEPIESREL